MCLSGFTKVCTDESRVDGSQADRSYFDVQRSSLQDVVGDVIVRRGVGEFPYMRIVRTGTVDVTCTVRLAFSVVEDRKIARRNDG
jgi:hypothetical protein